MLLCVRPSWTAMCHYSYCITDGCPRLSVSHLLLFLVSGVFTSILITPFFLILFFLLSDFIEAVHHVSVSINMSHSSLVCGEAWGTDPHFSWLHERAPITNSVGSVSEDGTTLIVTMTPFCGHFTCMVSNKLGYSSAIYTAGTSSLFFYMK